MSPVQLADAPLALAAATPAAWLRTHLEPRLGGTAPGDWSGLDRLELPRLRELHALTMASRGASPAAAAKWLCGWYAGGVAAAIGLALVTAEAALVPAAGQVRWRVNPGGWPDAYSLGALRVVVAAGHPWAGQPGVDVVATLEGVRAAALAAAVAVASPLVERCSKVAKVGRVSLWAEIADCYGLAAAGHPDVPVRQRVAEAVAAAVALPEAPWRARPVLVAEQTPIGPTWLSQKGGCCLDYQTVEPVAVQPVADEPVAAEPVAAEAVVEPEPRPYCDTCSLRDFADCASRQLRARQVAASSAE
ncbi:hypothetical protein [Motilibacter deserti]|uniref:Uncharacterized protein n=1 Tax=Motilibacter deserti TaxID=2714956 RepID=A0ABX0GSZ9_9ACTN|nr:hypothetical protein [Motilibacter deserti]NHC13630.1 hypothetical protein [Motilibacter deserti]